MQIILWICIIVGGIGIDQLTKYLSVKYLMEIGSVPIIKDVLHLTYVENTGAAFGILKDHRWIFMTLSTVSIIGIGVFLFIYRKKVPPVFGVAVSLIISGGIGNMIDRIGRGFVVDFVDFTLIDFYVFNAADAFVCIGSGLVVIYVIVNEIKASKQKKLEPQGKKDGGNSENI